MEARSFETDLANSHLAIEGSSLLPALRMRFPSVVRIQKANERDDRLGTDYWLHRRNGSPISVDIKVRSRDCRAYGVDDLCLELWSAEGKQVGWTLDAGKATDYIGWYWSDTSRLYIAPFSPLCSAFMRYREEWIERYGKKIASTWHRGTRYQSVVLFVPCDAVEAAMASWASGFPSQQLIV